MKSRVKIVFTTPDAEFPKYAKQGDAGADVFAVSNSFSDARVWDRNVQYRLIDDSYDTYNPGDYKLHPHQTVLIDLGFKIQLEPGWEMQVRSRSGLAKRGLVVANSPGTIDSGYRGPCMVLLHNNTKETYIIKPGNKIAQFVLKESPVAEYVEVDDLDDSDRGVGGFGSTGV